MSWISSTQQITIGRNFDKQECEDVRVLAKVPTRKDSTVLKNETIMKGWMGEPRSSNSQS